LESTKICSRVATLPEADVDCAGEDQHQPTRSIDGRRNTSYLCVGMTKQGVRLGLGLGLKVGHNLSGLCHSSVSHCPNVQLSTRPAAMIGCSDRGHLRISFAHRAAPRYQLTDWLFGVHCYETVNLNAVLIGPQHSL
jgi:hypothetical protein